MTRSMLQVYILCCGENDAPKINKTFDAYFCQNEKNARTAFQLALGRMPTENELKSAEAEEVLKEITLLSEETERVLIVASADMARELAGRALETPLEAVPLSIEPFHYAHLQWGNKRCPGKWFLQRWNTSRLPEE